MLIFRVRVRVESRPDSKQQKKNLVFLFSFSKQHALFQTFPQSNLDLLSLATVPELWGKLLLEAAVIRPSPALLHPQPLSFQFTVTFVFSIQPRRRQQPRPVSVCVAACRWIPGVRLRERSHLCCAPFYLAVTDADSPGFLGEGVIKVDEKCRKLSPTFSFPSPSQPPPGPCSAAKIDQQTSALALLSPLTASHCHLDFTRCDGSDDERLVCVRTHVWTVTALLSPTLPLSFSLTPFYQCCCLSLVFNKSVSTVESRLRFYYLVVMWHPSV